MSRIYLRRDLYRKAAKVNMEKEYPETIISRAKKIKLLVLDVDGVLSDGRIIYGDHGDEIKSFDVSDGLGIFLVRRAGIKTAILTARGSNIVKRRAKELKIDKLYKDFHYKIEALRQIRRAFKLQDEEICFVGDDLIDIPVLKRVGLAVCPSSAVDEVKATVHVITRKRGGRGAVREICDLILKSQGKWKKVTEAYFEG